MTLSMIFGSHILLYSRDADADREFFRGVLNFPPVDAGGGWLIFTLPPAELAVHPDDGTFVQKEGDHAVAGAVLYLMCDDVAATVARLRRKKVQCSPVAKARWGQHCLVKLPSGLSIGLYQPSHPVAVAREASPKAKRRHSPPRRNSVK